MAKAEIDDAVAALPCGGTMRARGCQTLPFSTKGRRSSGSAVGCHATEMQRRAKGVPPRWLLESFSAFIPKGTEDAEVRNAPDLTRAPERTRPLQLSKTDSNIVAKAVDAHLQASGQGAPHQRIFVKGMFWNSAPQLRFSCMSAAPLQHSYSWTGGERSP